MTKIVVGVCLLVAVMGACYWMDHPKSELWEIAVAGVLGAVAAAIGTAIGCGIAWLLISGVSEISGD